MRLKLSSFLQMKPNLLIYRLLGWKMAFYYILVLGRIYFCIKRTEKIQIELSTQAAFGHSNDKRELASITRDVFRGVLSHYYEKLFNAYADITKLKLIFENSVEAPRLNKINEALKKGKGVLFVTGHYGGVEFLPGYLASRGYPVAILVRFSSERLRYTSLVKAEKFHTTIIDVDRTPNIMKAISENLRNNRIVVTQCDEVDEWKLSDYKTEPFLGKCIHLDRTINVIAKRTGASIVFGLMERQPNRRYKLIIASLDGLDGAVRSSLEHSPSAVILRTLEQHIYAHPEQWYQWGKYATVRTNPIYSVRFQKGKSRPHLEPAMG